MPRVRKESTLAVGQNVEISRLIEEQQAASKGFANRRTPEDTDVDDLRPLSAHGGRWLVGPVVEGRKSGGGPKGPPAGAVIRYTENLENGTGERRGATTMSNEGVMVGSAGLEPATSCL
jgi:hypothetical protein